MSLKVVAMKSVNVNELREIQLSILDSVAEFCEKNNIKYFLAYGTLIGAVRHKGYIPWDDDIDIIMPRTDYEKFINDFNNFSNDYKVYTVNNTEWFPFPYAKVSYENSIIKELSDNMKNHNIGINIDLFPIDGVPKDEKLIKKHLRRLQWLQNLLKLKGIVVVPSRSLYKNLILLIAKTSTVFLKPQSIAKKLTI